MFSLLILSLICLITVECKPNIVYILLDDVGYGDLFNGTATPYINSLVSEGVKFNKHYTSPTCTPSRASLLTGRYAARTGLTFPLVPGSPTGIPYDIPTMPEVLKANGYKTAMSGKWHLGSSQWKQTPVGRGFDVHVGCYMWDIDYYTKRIYYAPWEPLAIDWTVSFSNGTYNHFVDQNVHATNAITDAAVTMLTEHSAHKYESKDKNPLFLYVAYTAGHSPLQPAYEDIDSPLCAHHTHPSRKAHCELLVGADRGVRVIYDTIKRTIGEDTLVIITSDNGGSTWFGGMNYPFRGGKTTPLEGGVRVPALAIDMTKDQKYFGGSNAKKQREYNDLFHISDWFPTLLSFSNITLENYVCNDSNCRELFNSFDGMDLSASIRAIGNDNTESHRKVRTEMLLDMFYAEDTMFGNTLEAYRIGDMKFINGMMMDGFWYSEVESGRTLNVTLPIDKTKSFKNWALNLYVQVFIAASELFLQFYETILGVGAFDSARIYLTHTVIHVHLAKLVRDWVVYAEPSSSPLLKSHVADRCRSNYDGNICDYHNYQLFNITSDPLEQHPLDINDFPDLYRQVQMKLELLKRKRPLQQKFWMQLENDHIWRASFAAPGWGEHNSEDAALDQYSTMENDMQTKARNAGKDFVHPWYNDEHVLWTDNRLIDSLAMGDQKWHVFVGVNAACIVGFISVCWFLRKGLNK